MRALLVWAFVCVAVVARAAQPSVLQPADAMRPPDTNVKPDFDPEDSPLWGNPKPPLETHVIGQRVLHEEELVGDYHQPRWTARRRFPTTRVYVVPAGVITLETWLEAKAVSDNPSEIRWRSLYEMEIGLGHRLQLDFYLRLEQQGNTPLRLESERVELRYAFADWGKAWGNPTLYLEWIRPDIGAHWGEIKLLLGGEMAPGWHWGINLAYEHRFGNEQDSEYTLTSAVSWTAIDSMLSLGAELQLELTDNRHTRFLMNGVEFLVGPSLQWRPLRAAHIDLVWLIGPGWTRSTTAQPFKSILVNQPTVVVGWMF